MINKLLRFAILWVFVTGAFSCAKKNNPQKAQEFIVYPTPPNTPRIQFLKRYSTSLDIEKQRTSFGKFLAGEEEPKPILKPYGVHMHDGKIYICDLDREGLIIMDEANHTFEYFLPRGLGQLQLPINCFVDSAGYLFVADSKRKQVVIFDAERNYVNSIGELDTGKPTDVFVTRDKVWIANVDKGRIDVYQNDSTYQFLYSIPENNKGEGKLYQPTNIYVTSDYVYASDFGEFNIKIYDHQGKFIRKVGSYGKMLGQFARPKGIAVDKEENLYVVDAAFENVQIFNNKGQLLMFFGGSYQGPGDMWLPAKISISYEGLDAYKKYVHENYELKYLILVTNNFGPDRLSVYGFIEEKGTTSK